jgi:hypothetical protein
MIHDNAGCQFQHSRNPIGLIERSNAVVTAIMCMCNMYMQRAFKSPPTQVIVNQAAGVADELSQHRPMTDEMQYVTEG